MNRTIWLAAFCLAGLGGLCASKVTASIYPSEECAPDQTQVQQMVSDAITPDTLTRSDKAELTEAPAVDSTFTLPIESNEVSAATPLPPRAKQPMAASKAHPKTVMLPRKRPKIKLAKNANPDTAAIDSKNCSQPDGLGGLLRSLAGSPHCG
jgi:hypothetical protein